MLCAEIGQFLAGSGLGTFGTATPTIFCEEHPTTPDDVLVVRSTGGYTSDVKLEYDDPTVQVLTRAVDMQDAYNACKSAYDLLHGFRNAALTTGGTFVVLCEGIQSNPMCLGRDQNGRWEYSINFKLDIKNPSRRTT